MTISEVLFLRSSSYILFPCKKSLKQVPDSLRYYLMSIMHCLGWGSKTGFLLIAEPYMKMLCWLSYLQKTSWWPVWCWDIFDDNFTDTNLGKFQKVSELFVLQTNMNGSQRQLTRLVWNTVSPFIDHRVQGTEGWEHQCYLK